MAHRLVSLSWKDHTNHFSTVCKNFLDQNCLVDCVLSAEGQYLEAHRIILSACSPYFQMLFKKEREKHPLVVLVGASFETLQAVMDYVYCGKTQIPERKLESFMELAQTLQIKGLNALTKNDGNEGLRGSAGRNFSACPSEENLNNREGEDSSPNRGNSPEDSPERHLYHSDGYSDAQMSSPVPFEACRDPLENVQSRSAVAPPQEQQIHSECSLLAICTGVTVKQELLSEYLEPNQLLLDDMKHGKSMSENLRNELDAETAPAHDQQNLCQYSSYDESASGRVESASSLTPRHLQEQQLQHQQHRLQQQQHQQQQQISQMPDDVRPRSNLPKRQEQQLPVILLRRCDQLAKNMRKESADAHDVHEKEQNETDGERDPALGGQNTNDSSSTVGLPAARGRGRGRPAATEEWQQQQQQHCAGTERSPTAQGRGRQPGKEEGQGQRRLAYKCSYCRKTFSIPSLLQTHVRTHTGERPYKCSECDACFTLASGLSRHRHTHTGERPFKCSECDACFTVSSNLKRHRRTHTGERPFKCSECDACFTLSSNLKRHRRTHTGERPFKCSGCNACFRQARALIWHKSTHTGERPFQCSKGHAYFKRATDLIRHKHSYSGVRPFKCSECDACFKYPSALIGHKRIHTGERPFKCSECTACFRQKSALTCHKRIHTGERPFKCSECDASFRQSSGLVYHKRRHAPSATPFSLFPKT